MAKFPSSELTQRQILYKKYESIYLGNHFDAFSIKAPEFSEQYTRLKYVTVNFGKMLSNLCADMLFEEFPTFLWPKKDNEQFHNDLMESNNFYTQLYESGAEQSYFGDVVLRMRADNGRLIIEDIQPHHYEVRSNVMNVRAEPEAHVLAWKVKLMQSSKDTEAVFKEIHYKGRIEYELWELQNGEEYLKLPVGNYIKTADGKPHPEVVETKVNEFLVVHVPNGLNNTHRYGVHFSDYADLISLMYGVNNRLSRVDNILDAHGEPILAVPEGVLDDDGKVRREAFGVIEVQSTEAKGQVPQYIVWDAKLESAFDEIDRMVDYLFMVGDISPALFGKDKNGQAESGRALKYRLLRTLSKKHRKELYYDNRLKTFFATTQKFAIANSLTVKGNKLSADPAEPTIKWHDGIINDTIELLEAEEKKLDMGLTSRTDALATIDGITNEEAKKKIKQVDQEKAQDAPKFTTQPVTGKGDNADPGQE